MTFSSTVPPFHCLLGSYARCGNPLYPLSDVRTGDSPSCIALRQRNKSAPCNSPDARFAFTSDSVPLSNLTVMRTIPVGFPEYQVPKLKAEL